MSVHPFFKMISKPKTEKCPMCDEMATLSVVQGHRICEHCAMWNLRTCVECKHFFNASQSYSFDFCDECFKEEEEMAECEYCKDPKPMPKDALQEWDKCLACPTCYEGICRSVNGLCVHCGGKEEENDEGDDVCAAKCEGWKQFVASKTQ